MNNLYFWFFLTLVVVFAIFLSLKSRMNPKPSLLIGLGLFWLIFAYCFQNFADNFDLLINSPSSKAIKIGVGMMATSVTAMVGAIFGAAVTNRVNNLHKKDVDAVFVRMPLIKELYLKAAEEIDSRLNDITQPLSQEEKALLISNREKLLAKYVFEMDVLEEELRKLSS